MTDHRTRPAGARRALGTLLVSLAAAAPAPLVGQEPPLKLFVSVDRGGLGGVGTPEMTGASGKDYALARRLATEEVNAVVAAVLARHPDAEIVVNDSHGDMQNLLHTELDPRVVYIQGNRKPLGMVQGLDATFDGAVFLGYHARAGAGDGFLAHTGSGSVTGLWINDVEVGEGGMNAAYAGSVGVPVVLAAGDSAFVREITALPVRPATVATKVAETPASARLLHPDVVGRRLSEATGRALDGLEGAPVWRVGTPVRVRMRFATTLRADIVQAVPGVSRVDGTTVAFTADDMDGAYRLIRLMYKYITEG
ncbi:MAG: M55 family metallopeptidase [Gemmatimonadetes bacterium]|nr:M55 family metallopeptidase [Gemmatimonadota bacterium]